jgi:xanthine dehydrogenase YagR molybdenum-binding subunit
MYGHCAVGSQFGAISGREASMVNEISRRGVLGGAAVVGSAGWGSLIDPADVRRPATASAQETQRSRTLRSYIGTPTSRVDGRAKVTGVAKYAAEFNESGLALGSGLAHGSVVTSAITKGRILEIDTSEALRVAGVIDVLTHQNRPDTAGTDDAYKDETAPEGSPFRPLYDDKIKFNGQPIALVVAEEPEIARFAASLVRVKYHEETHVTDLYRQRDAAVAAAKPGESMFGPPKPRGKVAEALAAAAVRHTGEYYVPIEHHNPMEMYASTAIWHGDEKITVYDKTQGASCRPIWVAASVPACARSIRSYLPCWPRAPSSAQSASFSRAHKCMCSATGLRCCSGLRSLPTPVERWRRSRMTR